MVTLDILRGHFILVAYTFPILLSLYSQHTVQSGPTNASSLHNHTKCVIRWTVGTETVFKSHQISFALNETVTDTTMDGRSIKMVVKATSPNQWKEVQTSLASGKETTLIRTFLYDQMHIEMFVGNIKSSSTFLRRVQNK